MGGPETVSVHRKCSGTEMNRADSKSDRPCTFDNDVRVGPAMSLRENGSDCNMTSVAAGQCNFLPQTQ